ASAATGATAGTASYSVAVIAAILGGPLRLQLQGEAGADSPRADVSAPLGGAGAARGRDLPPALDALAHDEPAVAPRLGALGRGVGRIRRRRADRLRARRLCSLAPRRLAPG